MEKKRKCSAAVGLAFCFCNEEGREISGIVCVCVCVKFCELYPVLRSIVDLGQFSSCLSLPSPPQLLLYYDYFIANLVATAGSPLAGSV